MSLEPPGSYRKTRGIHRRGNRADQPDPNTVLEGTIFYVVDEGVTEYSDTGTWLPYSGSASRASTLVNYSYSINTTSPPGTNQVRFDAGHPYTTVTKLYFDDITADGQDITVGLLRVLPGSVILVQDKNEEDKYAIFETTADPIDHTTWVEFDVIWRANGSAIGGGQLVLVQSNGGPYLPPTFTPDSVLFADADGNPAEDAGFTYDSVNNTLNVDVVETPLIVGGDAAGSDLTLKSTNNGSPSGDEIVMKLASTEGMRIVRTGTGGISPIVGESALKYSSMPANTNGQEWHIDTDINLNVAKSSYSGIAIQTYDDAVAVNIPLEFRGKPNIFGAGALAFGGIYDGGLLAAGNVNNYNPTNMESAQFFFVNGNAGGSVITGIVPTINGVDYFRLLSLINYGVALTVNHEDANSTAAYRFTLPNAANLTINQYDSATFLYLPNVSRWYQIK